MNGVLIVGCGDTGRRLARLLANAGSRPPIAWVRTANSRHDLTGEGFDARAVDLDTDAIELPVAQMLVFYLAPPPGEGTTDPRLKRFLEAARKRPPARIVYISTSGVYGDCGGAWVDETRPPNPQSDRARRRLDAESQLGDFADGLGTQIVILRVGGIYGPGRLPVERLRAGGVTAVCPEEAPYSNRVHVEDLARCLFAAGQPGRPGGVYNVADGESGTMTEYFYAVADRAGLPRPPCVSLAEAPQALGPGMWSFVRESRRLDVTRMREELGLKLTYPTLSAGLDAIFAAENLE